MFHKEGHTIIIISMSILVGAILLIDKLVMILWLQMILQIILIVIFAFILQFFRNPKRRINFNDHHVVSPVDGKVVAIEQVTENEYFKDDRIQVSVFMSPLNVHVTRYPIGGNVLYSKYHPGKYLVAWHPKSSIENERTTIVVENSILGAVLFRQIAGAMAKRIINYSIKNDTVIQGSDQGFIKFGSRVDLFLPLDTKINVKLNQKVKGGESIIGEK